MMIVDATIANTTSTGLGTVRLVALVRREHSCGAVRSSMRRSPWVK